jgi:hypothetical protein
MGGSSVAHAYTATTRPSAIATASNVDAMLSLLRGRSIAQAVSASTPKASRVDLGYLRVFIFFSPSRFENAPLQSISGVPNEFFRRERIHIFSFPMPLKTDLLQILDLVVVQNAVNVHATDKNLKHSAATILGRIVATGGDGRLIFINRRDGYFWPPELRVLAVGFYYSRHHLLLLFDISTVTQEKPPHKFFY